MRREGSAKRKTYACPEFAYLSLNAAPNPSAWMRGEGSLEKLLVAPSPRGGALELVLQSPTVFQQLLCKSFAL